MGKLVNANGSIRLGIFDDPVDEINAMDHDLLTPLGRKVPGMVKKLGYKRFHFLGITTPEVMAGVAVVHLGYLAGTFAYVFHRDEGWIEETSSRVLPGAGTRIAPYPENPDSRFKNSGTDVRLDKAGVRVRRGSLEFNVDFQETTVLPPLRLCTRAGYRGWSFTRKAAPLPVAGTLAARGRTFVLDPGKSFAISDWTGGFLRHNTFWNWAAMATVLADGRSMGLNLSWGVNETGFTENAFWINSKMTKVDMVCFSRDDSGRRWRITSGDGRIDLGFVPDASRGERVNLFFVATRFTQYFGRFSGRVVTRDNEVVEIDSLPGWAEDYFARW